MADQTLQEQNPDIIFMSDSFITAKAGAADRLEGIKAKLASINIGSSRIDDLQKSDIHNWQRWVDQVINSELSAVYFTPIVRITRSERNLDKDGVAKPFFPDPLYEIATAMVAAQVVFHEYTDVDPNTNDAANALYNNALLELQKLAAYDGQVGHILLEGQEPKARSPFIPPGVMPRNVPSSS